MHTDEYFVQKIDVGFYVVRRREFNMRVHTTETPRFWRRSAAELVAKALNGAYDRGLMYPPAARDGA